MKLVSLQAFLNGLHNNNMELERVLAWKLGAQGFGLEIWAFSSWVIFNKSLKLRDFTFLCKMKQLNQMISKSSLSS